MVVPRISVDAISWRLRRRLGLSRELAAVATEVREVHPEERGERTRAFWLPGQLEKVREVQEETTHDYEMARIHDGPVVHAPTLAYRVDGGRLVDGVFYRGGARVCQVIERESMGPRALADRLQRCALPSSVIGTRYFGHFVTDDACTALLAKELAPPWFTATNQPLSAHVTRYLELYGLEPRTIRSALLDEAWLFQDFGMNAHKRARMAKMRDAVRTLPGSRTGHGVFFRRGSTGVHRGIQNEPDVEARLVKEGFEVVDVATQSVEEIIRRSRDAAIVCGVEGSALAHGLLSMAAGAVFVTLMPPYRFNNIFKDHCDALGMRYGFVVGEGARGAFTVNVDELLRTFDLA